MEETMAKIQEFNYDPKFVVNGAVGSQRDFCMGYMNPGASGTGYITAIKLSTGLVDITQALDQGIDLDLGTAGIVSYDRCECNDAYIGAINMVTASSFSGQLGAVWGYDLCRAEDLRNYKLYDQNWPDGHTTPVYSIGPLLDTTERLFGIAEQRRFNPLPGSMVICANKNATNDPSKIKKGWVWSFIGLSFLEDRNKGSNIFIEDCGIINNNDGTVTESDVLKLMIQTYKKVTTCTVLCGVDQDTKYSEMFIGFKYKEFRENQAGCALACGPYVTLAKNAIPSGCQPSDLTDMTITQWEQKLGLPPLKVTSKSELKDMEKGVL
ncbi:MAG: histidine decarboxylase [Desulfobacteraceae bacterium]|nr:histidine decarboxylase [Desulfobacteraceae bacterium]